MKMSINKFIYGTTNPTLSRRVGIITTYTILFLSVLSMYLDFIPSAKWKNIRLYTAITLTILILVPYCFRIYQVRHENYLKYNNKRKLFLYLTAPLVLFFIIWLSIIDGAASLYTYTFGHPQNKTLLVTKSNQQERSKGCAYQVSSKEIKSGFPGYICVTFEIYNNAQRKFNLETSGYTTYFGYLREH